MHAHSREELTYAAELFLQEAVFRSRGDQAGASLLERPDGEAGPCGLGSKPSVVLDLTPRAQELYDALWQDGIAAEHLELVQQVLGDWVREQDALDRKRNHFLKAFRGEHGADDRQYDAAQRALYQEGVESINREVDEARRAAAEALLAAGSGSGEPGTH